jgi:hypothetical protein
MCLGKIKGERSKKLQYVGIGSNVQNRIKADHHKLQYVTRDRNIWLGEVATPEPSGKKKKSTKATLDYAEWALAYFLELPLNQKKRSTPPSRSVTLLNHWWHKDYETPRRNRPHPDWPDLIDYPGPEYSTRIIWFGKKQKYIKST